MINYAHRGASEYAPENTLSSFFLGLLQGANGIETDVQRTKDGVLVLFHDPTIDRVTNGKGNLCDYTLDELKALKITANVTNQFFDRIVTLREFLEKFASYDINFAIELKVEGVEEETLAMVKEFGILNKTTFTSGIFACIKRIKELDETARVGWLVLRVDEGKPEMLQSIRGEEMAPYAEYLTEDIVKDLREKGLGVRAWGVLNIPLMKKMCDLKVDGMTINFPDRLTEYLQFYK